MVKKKIQDWPEIRITGTALAMTFAVITPNIIQVIDVSSKPTFIYCNRDTISGGKGNSTQTGLTVLNVAPSFIVLFLDIFSLKRDKKFDSHDIHKPKNIKILKAHVVNTLLDVILLVPFRVLAENIATDQLNTKEQLVVMNFVSYASLLFFIGLPPLLYIIFNENLRRNLKCFCLEKGILIINAFRKNLSRNRAIVAPE